jgi:acetolactate synthase-1/2/3 large subunit
MIKNIKISESDKQSLLSHEVPKDPPLQNADFSGVVVNKPWGYEYLMYQTKEVSIWMLYIKKSHSTSMHCHPNKKTSLFILLGEVNSSNLNDKFHLKEKDGLILDKGVFHQTEAISENGAFVMEIETPSNKTDLFRLQDKYKRVMQGYTNKKNITDKLYNYHYLFLENDGESTNTFGKHKFYIKNLNSTEDFHNEINSIESEICMVLSGEIKIGEKIISSADLIKTEEIKQGELISPVKLLFLHERKNLIKLSDYVISFLEKKRIENVFLVSGGNLMHLLESLRTNKNINYLCNHHEQASAMAAEAYSKMKNDVGFAMVTSGPGATNAITGVAGAWIDSNPLFLISGQSYSMQTIGNSGLRQLGVQEIDIVNMVKPITKYAVMIKNPNRIKYHLEKAWYLATSNRPGPVWIDIPIDIQMSMIEEKDLDSFIPPEIQNLRNKELEEKVEETIRAIKESKRPIILLGNGVRLGKAEKEFRELINKLKIPIVTSRNANDLMWDEHELYAGRVGSFGQRSANFAVQNSDLLLSIGSRISLAVTGWAQQDFARGAKKIVVDIDKAELEKSKIKLDIPINYSAKDFISEMLSQVNGDISLDFSNWKQRIKFWKEKYPTALPEYKEVKDYVNPYYFADIISNILNGEDVVVTDMGMSFQCIMQALKLKKGQRLFTSSGLAPMGFGLPGAIGACIANNKKRIICISGDGGLQMNIQELQTLVHYKLPIKLFVFNNKGYSSIRETQDTYFEGHTASDFLSGVSIPDIMKVAEAYGLKTKKIDNQENLEEAIRDVLDYPGAVVCDVNISEKSQVMPKQGAFDRPDGKTVPRPIEDMAPFMDREELEREMILDPVPFDPYKE